jgi:hypothetical protein
MNLKPLQQEMEKEIDETFCDFQEAFKEFTLKYMQKVADMYEKEVIEKDPRLDRLGMQISFKRCVRCNKIVD